MKFVPIVIQGEEQDCKYCPFYEPAEDTKCTVLFRNAFGCSCPHNRVRFVKQE